MSKKVCFVTLSRSDYASLRPVIRAALKDPEIDVAVVAGGSHLLERFGKSIDNIQKDDIEVCKIIDFLGEKDDSELEMARAYGRAYREFVEYLNSNRPDSVFILGDRWEMLAIASAASLLRIPIIHHSGGDITQGSLDNQTRYALSVLSHIHLVALDEHRERLLNMGEESWRVTSVGEPALTEIKHPADGVENIRSELGLRSDDSFVLATFHPTSFDSKSLPDQVQFFVEALDLIDRNIILTAPNPDPGSNTFLGVLQNYAAANANVKLFENLGHHRYYATMSEADFMIGNSSSGIWEAPSFGLPVINIGSRQKGRVRGKNVIDVDLEMGAIKQALLEVDHLKLDKELQRKQNPYVNKNTLELILSSIKYDISKDKLLAKIFVDPLSEL